MDKIVLKIGKNDISECYKRNKDLVKHKFGTPFCMSSKALDLVESAIKGCYIRYCRYYSECIRLRRKI